MKKFTKLLALTLALATLLVCLASCDTSGSVIKAYEEAGYTVSVANEPNAVIKGVIALNGYDLEEIDDEATFITCSKGVLGSEGLSYIIKFPSASELKDFLVTDEGDAEYVEAKGENRIRGNCLLLEDGEDTGADIFKK